MTQEKIHLLEKLKKKEKGRKIARWFFLVICMMKMAALLFLYDKYSEQLLLTTSGNELDVSLAEVHIHGLVPYLILYSIGALSFLVMTLFSWWESIERKIIILMLREELAENDS